MSRTGLRSDCRRRKKGGRKFWRKMDDLRERERERGREIETEREEECGCEDGKMEKEGGGADSEWKVKT